MKRVYVVLGILLLTAMVRAQDSKRIAITEKSDVPTADILKGLQEHCPNVSIMNDASKSDYTLEALTRSELFKGTSYTRFDLTLFDREGKAVFSTSTRKVGNAVKDVCNAINSPDKKKAQNSEQK